MAQVTTSKTINVSQLGVELGRVPLRAVIGEYVASDVVDQATLTAAVTAHVPDPNWVDPNPPPPSADQIRSTDANDALGQLITLAGGTANVRSKLKAVLAGTDSLTTAQAQRLLAAVALYALRDRADS